MSLPRWRLLSELLITIYNLYLYLFVGDILYSSALAIFMAYDHAD